MARKTEEKEGGSEDTVVERKGNLKPKITRQGLQKCKETIDPICRNLTLFSRHVPEDMRFGGGECREDSRQWRENCMEWTTSRRCNVKGVMVTHVHAYVENRN